MLIILAFFSLVNLRTRFDEILGRISDSKNIGRGFVDQSSNPDSNPRPDIKILGRKFKSSAESFRFAAGYLKLRYQTGCSIKPWYVRADDMVAKFRHFPPTKIFPLYKKRSLHQQNLVILVEISSYTKYLMVSSINWRKSDTVIMRKYYVTCHYANMEISWICFNEILYNFNVKNNH